MNATATVGQLVVERPARARIFEHYGIDYCCGGKKPLREACVAKGIAVDTILQALLEQDATPAAHDRDWTSASFTELADHIVATHHAYLKAELPRLDHLTEKVAQVHGKHRPELLEVRAVFVDLKAEMDAHMMKEEQILFPLCRQLDAAGAASEFHCGSIANPIAVMMREHDHAGAALERMRTLTNDYAPPADACNTYRAMLSSLAELEADLHQHVHKENNILFPRAIAAEACPLGS